MKLKLRDGSVEQMKRTERQFTLMLFLPWVTQSSVMICAVSERKSVRVPRQLRRLLKHERILS